MSASSCRAFLEKAPHELYFNHFLRSLSPSECHSKGLIQLDLDRLMMQIPFSFKAVGALLAAVAFLTLFAQLRIELPLNEAGIPITGQSFAVLVVAAIGGRHWGPAAVLMYLLLGALGLPVFAKGAGGWLVFTKGSGGYLYGFLLAAILVGQLATQRQWGKELGTALLLMSLGTAVILLCGLLQLSYLYDWEKALDYGFYPFWPGALIKIVLSALVLYGYHRLRRHMG